MSKTLKLTSYANEMLDEMSAKRKAEGALIKSKQDIVVEALFYFYKKEMKKKGKPSDLGGNLK